MRDEKITSPVSVSCQHRELRLVSRGGEQGNLGSQLATWSQKTGAH